MKKRWKAGILLLLVLMTVVWWNRKLLEINPFHPVMADTVYRVITCEDQSLLVADKSGNRIYRINQDRQIEFVLNGTRSQNGFYDAKQMYSGEDGSIYLLDVRRTGSRKMEQERILKYDRNGKMVQVVSDIRYDENERVHKILFCLFIWKMAQLTVLTHNGKSISAKLEPDDLSIQSINPVDRILVDALVFVVPDIRHNLNHLPVSVVL